MVTPFSTIVALKTIDCVALGQGRLLMVMFAGNWLPRSIPPSALLSLQVTVSVASGDGLIDRVAKQE